MTSKKIKGVLFDFDGTLTIPGAIDFSAIRKEICCPEKTPILEFIANQEYAYRNKCNVVLEEREVQAAKKSAPNIGAEKCIKALKASGISLGILTRNSLPAIKTSLKAFDNVDLNDFDAVMTRDDSIPKPHPDGVFKAAEKMRVSLDELVLVGDFRFDIMAGKSAQVTTILLSKNGISCMEPEDPEPDYVIDEIESVLRILEEIYSAEIFTT